MAGCGWCGAVNTLLGPERTTLVPSSVGWPPCVGCPPVWGVAFELGVASGLGVGLLFWARRDPVVIPWCCLLCVGGAGLVAVCGLRVGCWLRCA